MEGARLIAMDRLDAKGYISDPKSKAKSIVVNRNSRAAIARAARETLREKNRKRASGSLRGE